MKKTLIVAMLLIVIASLSAGGILYAQGQSGGKEYSGQRLFGIGINGGLAMPPEGDPPYYWSHINLVISNPDWKHAKHIEKIIITDAWTMEVTEYIPNIDEAWIEPHGVFEKDFAQLGISGEEFETYRFYNVDVYWTGTGEEMNGWLQEVHFLIEQDELGGYHVADLGPIVDREMENIK